MRSRERWSQTIVCWSKMVVFSAFDCCVFEIFNVKAKVLYCNMYSLIGFPLISKQMMLNDLEWPFYVKLRFHAGMSLAICGFQKQLHKNEERYSSVTANRNVAQRVKLLTI